MASSPFTEESIFCVIPVYNNKDTVRDVAVACRKRLDNVVVVDDGSTDADIPALFAGLDIAVLQHESNQGQGQAVLTALEYVADRGGRFVITIDADGQHYPRDLEKFIEILKEDETSVIIGCRRFDSENIPFASRFGRKFGNLWLLLETGVSIDDCQSGFRAYPVEYIKSIRFSGSRFEFNTEILTKAAWAGLRLREIPVDVFYAPPGLRITSFRVFWDNLRISWMHTRLVARRLLPWPHRRLVPATAEGSIDKGLILHPIKLLKALVKENATPGGLAAAAAVGTFLAVLPLISVHTIVILYAATRLHLNKVMAVNIQHFFMPPLSPFICIELGHYMRHGRWLTEVSYDAIVGQLMERLFEWLLGSLIFAPIAACVMGLIVFFIAQIPRIRRAHTSADS
ncbi:DUF2062 domain-containing protein [bacterium]|nr:DUF2062 domain-containing protein [bacterium]